MVGVGASNPGTSDASPGSMEELSIPALVSSLRSSFRKADFERVEKILVDREESIAATVKSNFSEALALKEVDRIEVEAKCESLRKENARLEERAKKAEEDFRVFSVEQHKKQREARNMNDLLEVEVRGLVSEKSAADGEAEKYKNLCRKLEEQVLRVEEEQKALSLKVREALDRMEGMKKKEQDCMKKIVELQVENRNLESGKWTAEMEATDWKKKYGELEARSLRLVEENRNLKAKGQEMCQNIERGNGSNPPDKSSREGIRGEDVKSLRFTKLEVERYDKKVEDVVVDGVGAVPASVIEIFDSDDEMEAKEHVKRSVAEASGGNGDRGTEKLSNILHLDPKSDGATLAGDASSTENAISTPTPKRKRTSRVVMSDSESVEDESGISKKEVMEKKIKLTEDSSSSSGNCIPAKSSGDGGYQELMTPSRQRLVSLSQLGELRVASQQISPRGSSTPVLPSATGGDTVSRNKGSLFRKLQYPVTEYVESHEMRGVEDVESMESNSEGESLGGFIITDSNASDDESKSNDTSEQEASSGSSIDQVIARIRRERSRMKWEYEADMLASFGKDPVICMKAVCALYRQQTADEKSVKEALWMNKRGFSKLDARRGSAIAEFLTDGNPEGPLTKSVNELQNYDHQGVESCYKLATHYSKQLFMIYQNGEDPHFLPT